MKKYSKYFVLVLIILVAIALPTLGYCSVDSSLDAIQSKLANRLLPTVGILGLMWAALSFFIGSQNARSHLILALIGAVVGFGAPAIINLLGQLVQ